MFKQMDYAKSFAKQFESFANGCCLIDCICRYVLIKQHIQVTDDRIMSLILSVFTNRKQLNVGDDGYVGDSNVLVDFIARQVGAFGWRERARSTNFDTEVDLAVVLFKYAEKTHFCLCRIHHGTFEVIYDGYGDSTCRTKGKAINYRIYF